MVKLLNWLTVYYHHWDSNTLSKSTTTYKKSLSKPKTNFADSALRRLKIMYIDKPHVGSKNQLKNMAHSSTFEQYSINDCSLKELTK